MTETIVVAVLSLAGTLIGTYLANRKSAALIAYRLEHLEEEAAVFEEKLKVANHRIDDLEHGT